MKRWLPQDLTDWLLIAVMVLSAMMLVGECVQKARTL